MVFKNGPKGGGRGAYNFVGVVAIAYELPYLERLHYGPLDIKLHAKFAWLSFSIGTL